MAIHTEPGRSWAPEMLSSYVYIHLMTKLFIFVLSVCFVSVLSFPFLSLFVHANSVPWPGTRRIHAPPAVESRSLNHWTSREVPLSFSFNAPVRNFLWRDDRLGRFRSRESTQMPFCVGHYTQCPILNLGLCFKAFALFHDICFLILTWWTHMSILRNTLCIRGFSKTEFLSFGTIDVWSWIHFCRGGDSLV